MRKWVFNASAKRVGLGGRRFAEIGRNSFNSLFSACLWIIRIPMDAATCLTEDILGIHRHVVCKNLLPMSNFDAPDENTF